jgi:hypothetical protein
MAAGNGFASPVATVVDPNSAAQWPSATVPPSGVLMLVNATSPMAAAPVTGAVSVALGGFCDSITFSVDQETGGSILKKMTALPYMNGEGTTLINIYHHFFSSFLASSWFWQYLVGGTSYTSQRALEAW